MRGELLELIGGYRLSQMIATAARLRIADHLRGGPQTAQALAQITGSHPDALYRVLRTLASTGVFAEDEHGRFRLTPMAEWLRSDVRGSLRAAAEVVAEPWTWRPWGALAQTVATGETAFDAIYGQDTWSWFADHPDAARLFDTQMDDMTLADAEALLGAFDFGAHRTIVDVGGGRGVLLVEILARHPGVRAILFNVAPVIESARRTLPPAIRERIELASGDFLDAVPAGGDVYILKNILHDWADAGAARILSACRRAMTPAATLLVIEHIIDGPNQHAPGKIVDVQMMVRTGGRNRSMAELRPLLTAAGFARPIVKRTKRGPDVLIAIAADAPSQ